MSERICEIAGCGRRHGARGYCYTHYRSLRRSGALPLLPEGVAREATAEERFWSRVDKSGDCWLWTAGKFAEGYGALSVDGKPVKAHRFAYELLVGPIPDGAVLDHMCHNADPTCPGGECAHRACVNPTHLDPTTTKINLHRSGRVQFSVQAAMTHCVHGHKFTPENTYEWRGARYCRTCRRNRDALRPSRPKGRKRERHQPAV